MIKTEDDICRTVDEIAARWGFDVEENGAGPCGNPHRSALREAYVCGFVTGRSVGNAGVDKPLITEVETPAESVAEGPVFSIRALGALHVQRDGIDLPLRNERQSVSLLGLLISHMGSPLKVDFINEALWPDASIDSAANRLNIALCYLRKALGIEPGDPPISRDTAGLKLELSSSCWLDVAEFHQAALSSSTALKRAALDLYRGDLLEDFLWEEWSFGPREELREEALRMLQEAAETSISSGELYDASEFLKRALEIDPYDESLYRKAILVEQRRGRHSAAVRYADHCRKRLAELGLKPSQGIRAHFLGAR